MNNSDTNRVPHLRSIFPRRLQRGQKPPNDKSRPGRLRISLGSRERSQVDQECIIRACLESYFTPQQPDGGRAGPRRWFTERRWFTLIFGSGQSRSHFRQKVANSQKSAEVGVGFFPEPAISDRSNCFSGLKSVAPFLIPSSLPQRCFVCRFWPSLLAQPPHLRRPALACAPRRLRSVKKRSRGTPRAAHSLVAFVAFSACMY